MFPDELAQELFVDTSPVGHGGISEGAAEFHGFEEDGLGLFVAEFSSQTEGDAHSSKARDGDLKVSKGEGFNHLV
jgi:hypothetical protein